MVIFSFDGAQLWRMSDLIYRPEEEVIAELEKFKNHLATCGPKT
jgi:histone-binding protein RBBP4